MMIVLLGLAGVYIFYFTDWFKPQIIHITHTSRAMGARFCQPDKKQSGNGANRLWL